MNFKDAVTNLNKEVDALLACGRTSHAAKLKDSDLLALKSALREMLEKLK